MARCRFIAETETVDTVSHVWIQKGSCHARPVRPDDVTEDALASAEFHGAPVEAILTWLKRFASAS